jgi:hypothetical protein
MTGWRCRARLSLDPSEIPYELSAGFGQRDAVAAFNLYPSTRGSELDGIGSRALQLLDHAPLHRARVRHVIQRADQLHGKRFGLAGHRQGDISCAAAT